MGKVCLLLPSHWSTLKGGAEYQADSLAKHLIKTTRHDVVYLARNVDDKSQGYDYNIIRVFPLIRQQKYGLFWDAVKLYKTLVDINPDVIWQHVGCAYTGIAAFYCKRHNKSLIWHVASDKNLEPTHFSFSLKKLPVYIDGLLLRYGIRNVKSIIVQTKKQAELLLENYGLVTNQIISNFHPLPESFVEKADKFTVLWVANFKRLKQPEKFIQLAEECEEYKNVVFKMIGRREKSNWCDDLLNDINERNNLEYLGEMDMNMVNEQIGKAHILVNTSLFEGFPNTFIQAWMRGVPTVSLNVDPDLVMQENNIGFCAGDMKSLKKYILTMCDDENSLKEIGNNARKFATKNFSMKNADNVIELINAVLEKQNRA